MSHSFLLSDDDDLPSNEKALLIPVALPRLPITEPEAASSIRFDCSAEVSNAVIYWFDRETYEEVFMSAITPEAKVPLDTFQGHVFVVRRESEPQSNGPILFFCLGSSGEESYTVRALADPPSDLPPELLKRASQPFVVSKEKVSHEFEDKLGAVPAGHTKVLLANSHQEHAYLVSSEEMKLDSLHEGMQSLKLPHAVPVKPDSFAYWITSLKSTFFVYDLSTRSLVWQSKLVSLDNPDKQVPLLWLPSNPVKPGTEAETDLELVNYGKSTVSVYWMGDSDDDRVFQSDIESGQPLSVSSYEGHLFCVFSSTPADEKSNDKSVVMMVVATVPSQVQLRFFLFVAHCILFVLDQCDSWFFPNSA